MRFAAYKRWCGVKAQFGLLDIDNQKEQFTVDLCLFFHWRPRRRARRPASNSSGEEDEHARVGVVAVATPSGWVPRVSLLECDDAKEIERSYFHNRQTNDWFMLVNWIATYRADLRLQRFPFDRQRLRARVEASCELRPWALAAERQPASFATSPAGCYNYSTVEDSWRFDHATAELEELEGTVAHMSMCMFVERKPEFFIWNVVVVLYPIVATAAAAVATPAYEMADRMSVSLTLMLTAVAFKVRAQSFFGLCCFFCCCLVLIHHVACPASISSCSCRSSRPCRT